MSWKRSAVVAGSGALGLIWASVVLSGCGSASGPSQTVRSSSASSSVQVAAAYAKTAPAQIEADALAALKSLRSVRIVGEILDAGKRIGVDLRLDTSHHCIGSMTLAGHTVDLVGPNANSIYLKADQGFWTTFGGGAAASLLAGKWITGMSAADFFPGGGCDLTSLLKQLPTGFGNGADWTAVVKSAVVAAVPAVDVRVVQGADSAVITVAATSPHYVLKIAQGSQGAMTFTDLDQPFAAPAPVGAINIDQLGAGAK